jgi:hypothetical protein
VTALSEVIVEFDRSTQVIGPLREAAYRLIGIASCAIEGNETTLVCRLSTSEGGSSRKLTSADLRQLFLDFVTDENLREKVAKETSATRDLILALAFGALANESQQDA